MKSEKEQLDELEATFHWHRFDQLKKRGQIEVTPDVVVEFLNDFVDLTKRSRPLRTGGHGVDREQFAELQSQFGVNERDCVVISRDLLKYREEDMKYLGKRMLYTLSDSGAEHATLIIMTQALLANRRTPGTLRSSEIQHASKRLSEIATTGKNYRAMVLEGKVAYELGKVDYAIKMWRQAVEPAIAASEEAKKFRAKRQRPPDAYAAGTDLIDLSAPWVELHGAYLPRLDYDNAKWAIGVGCEQDDPISHYAAALFERRHNSENQHIGTSGWLYHMTKAAASGYCKAAHQLGIWYASNGWPYLEDDEPPDHVKPTPFDTYPPDSDSQRSDASIWDNIRSALGLNPETPKDPKEHIFHTAAFPSTPFDRNRMALEWLRVSVLFTYAPSLLVAARLLLQETLWSELAAPKEAIELSDERYTYASKADFEAGKPIKRPPKQTSESEQEVKNPHYVGIAKECVRDVFYAASAQAAKAQMLRNVAINRRRGMNTKGFNADDFFVEDSLGQDMTPNMKKWFRFPEIWSMYADDAQGRLYDYDDPSGVDLLTQAREICEEQGWDIYADDGGLMYKQGLGRGHKQQGVVAAGR